MSASLPPSHDPRLAALVPSNLLPGLIGHVVNHTPCGTFLTAVLENNLRDAVGHADETNLPALPDIVRYCRWCLPSDCWGSAEKVRAWLSVRVADEAADLHDLLRDASERG